MSKLTSLNCRLGTKHKIVIFNGHGLGGHIVCGNYSMIIIIISRYACEQTKITRNNNNKSNINIS